MTTLYLYCNSVSCLYWQQFCVDVSSTFHDQAFKLFDADGDGKINGEELKALVDKVGENVRMKITMVIMKMKMIMVIMKMKIKMIMVMRKMKMIMVVMKMKMIEVMVKINMVRMIGGNNNENGYVCYRLINDQNSNQ